MARLHKVLPCAAGAVAALLSTKSRLRGRALQERLARHFQLSEIPIGPAGPAEAVRSALADMAREGVSGVTYDLYAGTLAAIHLGTYDHACLAPNLPAATAEVPAGIGDVYYLVAAKSASFGLGSLGSSSAGVPRPNASPCP